MRSDGVFPAELPVPETGEEVVTRSLITFLREEVPQPRYLVYLVNIVAPIWGFIGVLDLVRWLG